jgi:NAD(P)-dependent dehydrogenase (short-subunit alcohol dehydrogenase family)
MEQISLKGQVAIVTGAGSGLGRAEALELARRGASVVVNDFNRERAEAVVAEVGAAGGTAVADTGSVTDPDAGERLAAAAAGSFGRVDALVNNAGFFRPDPFGELTPERIDAVIGVHLRAAFLVTQPIWRIMRAQGYGRIVMTGSTGGMFAVPGNSSYSAAKAGIYGLTKVLAFEGAGHGIKANCLLPYAVTSIRTDGDPGIPRYLKTLDEAGKAWPSPRLSVEERTWRSNPVAVAPLVGYLSSSACEPNGEAFGAFMGRFARVFVGVTDGWLAREPAEVTAETIATHMNTIRDVESSSVPMWDFDYMASVIQQVAKLDDPPAVR